MQGRWGESGKYGAPGAPGKDAPRGHRLPGKVGEPGTPSESIGKSADVPAACAAVSGATTPSISPLPKLRPLFETRLAMP